MKMRVCEQIYPIKTTAIIALLLVITSSLASLNTGYRLPSSLRPEHYKVQVLTHLGDENGFQFEGTVWITILCEQNTSNITLHSNALNITAPVQLSKLNQNGDGKEPVAINYPLLFDSNHDFVTIFSSEQNLTKGDKYELVMEFRGELAQGLQGYYRSGYFDIESEKTRWISVTQFESIYARRGFPCFDEPNMKARFEMILGHHKNYTALSNMPIQRSSNVTGKPGWIWDHFEETVPMSTYLVAYSINDFEYREAVVKMTDDVVFRVWARRDAIDQVDYANLIGPKVLKFYEEYFDVKFPLPKMDMIAIPDSDGAMENWGLITFNEGTLLYSPTSSSASSQYMIASIVAHELAHQWFGNLVTMKWWTDIWLNEGFATYVASLGVEHLHPEWNSIEEEFVISQLFIYKFDALKSSHPVSVLIGNPNEISQVFDAISYEKGSAIIRMMQLFLGEETFRHGVSNYLKKHKYGNAEQADLWDCLTEEAHKRSTIPQTMRVNEIMDSWTLQTGYPLVSVNRNYALASAHLSQIRYLADIDRLRSDLEYCWWIPLSYTMANAIDFNDTQPKTWLSCDEHTVPISKLIENMADPSEWVLFNVQLSGIYKVKYDECNWNLLIAQLNGPNYTKIGVANRAQLIDDALDLAWTGDLDYGIALRLVNYLKFEEEYVPWQAALDNLNSLDIMLKRTPLYGLFQEYMQTILSPIYKTLGGLNNATTNNLATIKQKILIAEWACRFHVDDCQQKSRDLFKNWMAMKDPDTNNPIPLDLRPVVYCSAISGGQEQEWDFLWDRYNRSNVETERSMILSSLGCSREMWLLARYLDYSLDESTGIRKHDSPQVFASIVRGSVGFYIGRSFFLDRFSELYNYLYPDMTRLARYIKPLAIEMTMCSDYDILKKFVTNRSEVFEESSQSVEQALEIIKINTQWNGHYDNIKAFLNQQSVE